MIKHFGLQTKLLILVGAPLLMGLFISGMLIVALLNLTKDPGIASSAVGTINLNLTAACAASAINILASVSLAMIFGRTLVQRLSLIHDRIAQLSCGVAIDTNTVNRDIDDEVEQLDRAVCDLAFKLNPAPEPPADG